MIIMGFISKAELRHGLEQATKNDSMNDQSPCYFGNPHTDDQGNFSLKFH